MAAMDREASGRVDLIVRNAKVTTLQDGGDMAELNRVAPRVPVLVLFGYSRVLLNRAGPRR